MGTMDSMADYKVREFVAGLLAKGLENEQVEQKIFRFFKDYDQQKEP